MLQICSSPCAAVNVSPHVRDLPFPTLTQPPADTDIRPSPKIHHSINIFEQICYDGRPVDCLHHRTAAKSSFPPAAAANMPPCRFLKRCVGYLGVRQPPSGCFPAEFIAYSVLSWIGMFDTAEFSTRAHDSMVSRLGRPWQNEGDEGVPRVGDASCRLQRGSERRVAVRRYAAGSPPP